MKRTLVLALAIAALTVVSLPAATISVTVSGPVFNTAGLEAARTAWLGGMNWDLMEDFEGFTANQNLGRTSLATSVGTITVDPTGQGSTGGGTGGNELLVLNNTQTRFGGRYNTTPGGANWLDSNDITNFYLTLNGPVQSIFFFMTDVEDVAPGGAISIRGTDSFGDIVERTLSLGNLSNGASYFVAFTSTGTIDQIRFLNLQRNDGFGIDDIGVINAGEIPEPGTIALLGAGLLGLGILRRRRAS